MEEYYVYEWFIVDTNEVFYVGKGKNKRYKQLKKNKYFMDMYNTHKCDVRIVFDKMTEYENNHEIILNNEKYMYVNDYLSRYM
jgi:hypothetical protein